jgi:hypothetical protein
MRRLIAGGFSSSTWSGASRGAKHDKRAKPEAPCEGMQRAPTADMHDVRRIETINREQLATATDRLLLRGRTARQRSGRSTVGSRPWIAIPTPRAEGSQPSIVVAPSLAHPLPPKRTSPLVIDRSGPA